MSSGLREEPRGRAPRSLVARVAAVEESETVQSTSATAKPARRTLVDGLVEHLLHLPLRSLGVPAGDSVGVLLLLESGHRAGYLCEHGWRRGYGGRGGERARVLDAAAGRSADARKEENRARGRGEAQVGRAKPGSPAARVVRRAARRARRGGHLRLPRYGLKRRCSVAVTRDWAQNRLSRI